MNWTPPTAAAGDSVTPGSDRAHMPALTIGISGGSGSGKSAVSEELRERLNPRRVKVINQDQYFLPTERLPRHTSRDGGRSWPDHNHPDSFDFQSLRTEVRAAQESGVEVVIVEGILVLHDPELRELMDLKVFVAADADERIVRRIRRNVARGYPLDEVTVFYLDSVRYRHEEFCEPTRAYADLVIPGGGDDRVETEKALDEVCARVRSRLGSAR